AEDEECPNGQLCRNEQCSVEEPVIPEDAGGELDAEPDTSVEEDAGEDSGMSLPDGMSAVRAAARAEGVDAIVEVTVDGQGSCEPGACMVVQGATVRLRAPQVTGYRFTGWSGDPGCQGEAPELVLSPVSSDIMCVANYAWRLSVRGELVGGNGAVSASSSSIAASCSGERCEVDRGQAVTLLAPELPGVRFAGWSGPDCEGIKQPSVTLTPKDHDIVCTATYVVGFVIRGRAQGAEAVVAARSDAPSAQCTQSACQVDAGSSVTLEAPEVEKHRFTGFSGPAACLSSERVLTIASADADLECVANYLPRHDVTGKAVGISPAPAIVASSSDTFASCSGDSCRVDHGGAARLTAPTVSGYRPKTWSGSGCDADAGAAQNLSDVTQDIVCTVEYVQGVGVSGSVVGASATIVASSSSPGASCNGASCGIDVGGSVTLVVDQPVGFQFNGWSGDAGCTGTTPSITLSNVNDSRTCTATFTPLRFRVDARAEPTAGGAVQATSSSSTAVCNTSGCAVDYDADVTLTAAERTGYRFTAWSGCSTSTSATLQLNDVRANQSCVANFALRTYPVRVSAVPTTGGTLPQPCSGAARCSVDATHGTQLDLQATAAASFVFTNWSGCVSSTNPAAKTPVVTGELTCSANFGHSVVARVEPANAGSVQNCSGAACVVGHGANLSLGPVSVQPTYEFAGWTGCQGMASANNGLQLSNIQQNLVCTANFRLRTYQLEVAAAPAHGGTITTPCNGQPACSVPVTHGATPALVAAPAAGFLFAGWRNCSVANASAPSTTLGAATGNANCVAAFNHQVTARVEPAGLGSVPSCGGSPCFVDDGGSITLGPPSVSDGNYVFRGWDCGGGLTSQSASFPISPVTRNLDCVARYERPNYKIGVSTAPANGGVITSPCSGTSCSVEVLRGAQPTLTVVTDKAFVFRGWTGRGCSLTDPSKESTTAKPVVDHQECVANFQHSVIAVVDTPAVGPVTTCPEGAPCYVNHGGGQVLTPPTHPDYVFAGWQGCQGTQEKDGSITLTNITANLRCTATYRRPAYTITTVVTPDPATRFGTVTCNPTSCTVDSGGSITLTATPINASVAFVGWSGCSTSTSRNITLNTVRANQTCTANFRTARADLVIDQISAGTPARLAGAPGMTVPLTVRVTNIGDVQVPANTVKVAVHNGQASTNANVVSYNVSGQSSIWYPFVLTPLSPGASVTLTGTATVTGNATSVTLFARIDSCSGEEFINDPPCRVQELSETNNFSTGATATLPLIINPPIITPPIINPPIVVNP
ncbi:MAG TPA: hypothetical protein VFZ61_10190, partial [Polyangiales bacterium]